MATLRKEPREMTAPELQEAVLEAETASYAAQDAWREADSRYRRLLGELSSRLCRMARTLGDLNDLKGFERG